MNQKLSDDVLIDDLINEVFNVTGEKVDKDDPLIISCVIYSNIIKKQNKNHLENNQFLIDELSNVIAKKTQVKKRNIINIIILIFNVVGFCMTAATLYLILLAVY